MDISTGFFTVGTLTLINNAKDLAEAKRVALAAVNAQPNARDKNIKKALAVINTAKSKKSLLLSLTNFMLAHPSEGLGMGKGS